MTTPKEYDPAYKYVKYSSKPHYEFTIVYSEHWIGLRMVNTCVELNKPIYLCQSILDISKLIMYRWRYEKLPAALPPHASIKIIAGDTDSFFIRVKGVSRFVYETTLCELGHLDTSNFDPKHVLFTNERRAKLGCIKNEYPNNTLPYMVFVRSKVYLIQSYETPDKPTKVTAKGINGSARKTLTLQDFMDSAGMKEVKVSVTNIISHRHAVTTTISEKWALSCTDVKRAWIDNKQSYPYGHYMLEFVSNIFL